jgi:hypothetical protein
VVKALDVTATRIIVRGATIALTRRCTMRKAFVAPWHPLVRDIWLYAMADAQQHTGVAVHHGMLVLNHEHLSATGGKDNLPDFTARLHREASCAIDTLLARERFDAPGEVWDDRAPHYMRLMDDAAQASHLVYQHINCVAAGLIERPELMPDFAFDFGLWKTGSIDVKRPPVYFSEDRPEILRLEVTPPPLLYRAFGGDIERLVYHMDKLVERALETVRDARGGRAFAGVQRVLQMHPWNEPQSLREPRGRRVPTFRVGARGILGQLDEIACATETRAFRQRHERSRCARLEGDATAVFPFGTYQMRVLHDAPVESAPAHDARVAMPGPLLSEIKAELHELAAGDERERRREDARAMLAEVEAAFADEAHEIDEHTALELPDERATRADHSSGRPHGETPDTDRDAVVHGPHPDARAGDDTGKAPVAVRHRFDPHQVPSSAARRVIVLRNGWNRRRPRTDRHGSDPPA